MPNLAERLGNFRIAIRQFSVFALYIIIYYSASFLFSKIDLESIAELESGHLLADKAGKEIHYVVVALHDNLPVNAETDGVNMSHDVTTEIVTGDVVVEHRVVIVLMTVNHVLSKPLVWVVEPLQFADDVGLVLPVGVADGVECFQGRNPFTAHNFALQGEGIVAATLVEGEIIKSRRVVTLVQELQGGILCVESLNSLVLVDEDFGYDSHAQILAHSL